MKGIKRRIKADMGQGQGNWIAIGTRTGKGQRHGYEKGMRQR